MAVFRYGWNKKKSAKQKMKLKGAPIDSSVITTVGVQKLLFLGFISGLPDLTVNDKMRVLDGLRDRL